MDGDVGWTERIAGGGTVGDTWGLGVLKGVGFVGRIGVIGEGIFVFPISPKFIEPGPRYPGVGLEGTLAAVEEPGTKNVVSISLIQFDLYVKRWSNSENNLLTRIRKT